MKKKRNKTETMSNTWNAPRRTRFSLFVIFGIDNVLSSKHTGDTLSSEWLWF